MLKIHKYASNTNTNTHGKTRNTQIQKYRHTQIQISLLGVLVGGGGGGNEIYPQKSPLGKTAVTLEPKIKKNFRTWQIEAIS